MIDSIERIRQEAKVLLKKEVEYLREVNDEDLYILHNPMKEVFNDVLIIALR